MHWVTTLFIFVRQLDASLKPPCDGESHTLDCSLSNKWISRNWKTRQFIHTVEIIIDKIRQMSMTILWRRSSGNCAAQEQIVRKKVNTIYVRKRDKKTFSSVPTLTNMKSFGFFTDDKHSTNANILIWEMTEDDLSLLWCLLGCQRL